MKNKYSKEFVEKCRRKARSVRSSAAKRYFLINQLEDIEAWALLQFIEGRSLLTRNNFLIVDYMRSVLGDPRTEKFTGFWNFQTSDDNPTLKNVGSDPRETLEQTLDDKKIVGEMEMNLPFILTSQECRVIRLYYFHDMERGQIATVMGVTISRITQIYKKAVLKLRRFYNTHLTDF